MTNPTEAPEAPPRWRLEPTLTTDQAPSAFPMREEEDTACTGGDTTIEGADADDADALDVLLPDADDPFADLEPLLEAEGEYKPCVPPDCPQTEADDQPADSDPADPDGGPERPEPEDPISGAPLASSATANVDQGDGTTPEDDADQEGDTDG